MADGPFPQKPPSAAEIFSTGNSRDSPASERVAVEQLEQVSWASPLLANRGLAHDTCSSCSTATRSEAGESREFPVEKISAALGGFWGNGPSAITLFYATDIRMAD